MALFGGEHPPYTFQLEIAPNLVRLFENYKPGEVIPVIRVHFVFRRGVRPDRTPFYYYTCITCGYSVGLDWLSDADMSLAIHDCQHKCSHLTAKIEVGENGESIAKWVPAFDRYENCRLCGCNMMAACRRDK